MTGIFSQLFVGVSYVPFAGVHKLNVILWALNHIWKQVTNLGSSVIFNHSVENNI